MRGPWVGVQLWTRSRSRTMGACATKVDIAESEMKLQTTDERIGEMLCMMNAHHCKDMELSQYYAMGRQDAQYSPNMTIQDKINLEKIGDIIQFEPSRGSKTVGYFLATVTDIMKLAVKSELNMIRVLKENPDLMDWFLSFDPPHYMFNPHPNLQRLSKLVDEDGHSGASFGLCCHSVKRRLQRPAFF